MPRDAPAPVSTQRRSSGCDFRPLQKRSRASPSVREVPMVLDGIRRTADERLLWDNVAG